MGSTWSPCWSESGGSAMPGLHMLNASISRPRVQIRSHAAAKISSTTNICVKGIATFVPVVENVEVNRAVQRARCLGFSQCGSPIFIENFFAKTQSNSKIRRLRKLGDGKIERVYRVL